MKIKILITTIIIAIISTVIIYVTHENSSIISSKPTIKIGVTLPLTGNLASLGQSSKDSLELAMNKLNKSKLRYNYKLIIEDDQFKPIVGSTNTQKLINVDKVSALLSFGSPVGNAVTSISEKYSIPHINGFASDPNVANGKFSYIHYTPAKEDVDLFIKVLQKKNIQRITILEQANNPGSKSIIDELKLKTSITNIKIDEIISVNGGDRDFRTILSKLRDSKTQLLVLIITTPELEIFTKQFYDFKIKIPITSIEAFEFSDQLQLFEGNWYINGADPETWFINDFKDQYHYNPKFGAANMYDALFIIVNSIEKAGDGEDIPDYMAVNREIGTLKNFDGALGENLSMGENHMINSKAVVRIIKDGQPITIKY